MLTHLLFSQILLGNQAVKADANILQSHVAFLASDLLEGRGTPSKGLDIAAEYIAGEFQKIGLEKVNGSYFQATDYTDRRTEKAAKVRNVLGMIKGSDSKLRDSYVLVTAHYDHLGSREGEGDQIFNGANDNASGVAGVIETARLLKAQNPKRTIIFMTFWGEERGLLGSTYYVNNPVVPLKQTNCVVNLEQIGRTDDSEGPRVAEFNLTGFELSDMGKIFEQASKPAGIKVTMHPSLSIPYFSASDNAPFARVGVPAHTISCAYQFPDYHRPADHADKLDYPNLAKVVNGIALGVKAISDSPKGVTWNESEPKAQRYFDAWKKLTAG